MRTLILEERLRRRRCRISERRQEESPQIHFAWFPIRICRYWVWLEHYKRYWYSQDGDRVDPFREGRGFWTYGLVGQLKEER